MNELNNEVKKGILQAKIAQYRQQYYSHQIDAQIARDIGGMEAMLQTAQTNMASAQKIVDALEGILKGMGDAKEP